MPPEAATRSHILMMPHKNMLMGSLGEGYSFLNQILPNSYRINDVPAELYDGMIIVKNATPTDIKN